MEKEKPRDYLGKEAFPIFPFSNAWVHCPKLLVKKGLLIANMWTISQKSVFINMRPFDLYLDYICICSVLVYVSQEVDFETRVQTQVIYLGGARNFTWGVRKWAGKGSQPIEGMFSRPSTTQCTG